MPRPSNAARIALARTMKDAGASLAEVMAAVGYSQTTLYNAGLTWGGRHHTPEMIERVRDLYIVQGLPGTEVAKRLGLSSRNAVIGIADRHGMKRSPTVRAINEKRARGPQKSKPTPKPKPVDPVVVDFAPRPFVERRTTECCWPMTDCEPWLVCGRVVERGVYCGGHWAAAHTDAKTDGKDLIRFLRRHL